MDSISFQEVNSGLARVSSVVTSAEELPGREDSSETPRPRSSTAKEEDPRDSDGDDDEEEVSADEYEDWPKPKVVTVTSSNNSDYYCGVTMTTRTNDCAGVQSSVACFGFCPKCLMDTLYLRTLFLT